MLPKLHLVGLLYEYIMKNTIVWDTKSSDVEEIYKRFGGTSCRHLQVS